MVILRMVHYCPTTLHSEIVISPLTFTTKFGICYALISDCQTHCMDSTRSAGAGIFTYMWVIFWVNVGTYSSTMEHLVSTQHHPGGMPSLSVRVLFDLVAYPLVI